MKPEDTPFKPGWWAFGLGDYRPCESTYCLSDYEKLPPLPDVSLDGSLSWLGALSKTMDSIMEPYRFPEDERHQQQALLDNLITMAENLDLTLPPGFVKLMRSLELQDRVPSCTACFFDLPERIVPDPVEAGGYMLRFLVDQQWLFSWYLYLQPDGDHCVVVSPYVFDDEYYVDDIAENRDTILAHTLYCGPSFEEFLYRFWLENTIWFKVHDKDGPLTEEQSQYLAHYR